MSGTVLLDPLSRSTVRLRKQKVPRWRRLLRQHFACHAARNLGFKRIARAQEGMRDLLPAGWSSASLLGSQMQEREQAVP